MSSDPLTGVQGNRSDAAAASDTANVSRQSLFKRLLQKFTTQLPSVLDTDRLKVIDSEASGKLSNILTTLQAQIDFSESLWTDDSGAYYVRRVTEDETTHVITVIYTDPAGATVTPGAGLRPLNGTDKELQTAIFDATAGGTGYSTGDILARILIIDTSASPITATAIWMNVTTGAVISAPTGGTYVEVTQNVSLSAATLDALELVGIKGADGENLSSFDNPVPVSMPTMAAVTALTTPDSSPYSNDGTLSGATLPEFVPSPFGVAFGNAFLFDGSSGQLIDCGNGVSGPLRVSGVGTAAKFNLRGRIRIPTTIPATFTGIIGRASDANLVGGCQPVIFYDGAGGLLALIRDNGGAIRSLSAAASLVVDTNYEIEYDYDGVTHRLFVNGALADSGALSGVEAGNATDRFIIGAYDGAGVSSPFTGFIDDVQWSNTSRHVAAFTPSALPAVSDGNTLGLWPCDQTFGTIAVTGLVDVTDRAERILGAADLNGLTGAGFTQVTVGTAAVRLDTSALANRRGFSVKALKANTGQIYIGKDNTVTTSGATGGYELDKQEGWDAELTVDTQVWAIASAAGQVVCLAQVAK